MSTNRNADRAKHLLRHYLSFAVLASGNKYDGDCNSEIGEIVDAIIAAVVEELQAQPAPGFAQPSMFPNGEDAPLFTMADDAPAEPQIELMYRELSPRAVDVALACIDYAWPKNTVEGCWAYLNKLTASGDISEELSNEIRTNADFLFL